MALTKRQIVEGAFEEIALANYTFDLTPQELQSGLARIEGLLRSWASLGIDTGYIMPFTPDVSDLDDDSGMNDMYIEAVRTNGAIRLAPMFGKTVSAETRTAAKSAYERMLSCRPIPQMCLPRGMPRGAGNRGYYYGYATGCAPDGGNSVDDLDGDFALDGSQYLNG